MTAGADDAITIPARVTAKELADAIGRDLSEVEPALAARGGLDSPEDFLDLDLARAVAAALGVEVAVETRDLVLEALYCHETRGESPSDIGGRAEKLVNGVIEAREELDRSIEAASEHWSVARMPLIDRNILRLGLHELQSEPGTPVAVIISEAVRLAGTYSTERSASFVNGVLATLAKSIRS